ncbi:hypothetical protein KCU93_g9790, partial [Aureobasidium melanogenum]
MQEKIVEDITSNIMGILDSRLKTLLDETAPQIKVAVRQALGDRDRAPSQPSSNPVGYTPPAVGNDTPQASLVPKKTLARKSASKAKNIAVAVVCSLKPRPSARHPQLAGTLTKQDRTPRRFDSSTTATSPSEIHSQSSRSVSIVKIEESSDEGCFYEKNSDGDDDFDMKESSDSDDERSASDDGGSASDSDYIDVADHVDNAVNERSARSTRTAKILAGASRSGNSLARSSFSEHFTFVVFVLREAAALAVSAPAASLLRTCNRFSFYACLFAHHSALNTGSSPTCNHHLDVSFIRSLCQVMDQVPPWQRITEGYESPTEETAAPVKAVESLKDWKRRNPQQALDILGKNNTKLRQPEVRIVIWPAKDRHTDSQLRTIWKFYYKRCWHLAPYAFNSDLKPYAEFEWVTSPTSFRRLARDASQTIAQQPATATNSAVSTVKHAKLPQDNRRSGLAIAESIKAEPPPNAPRGPRNNTPSQASRFPRIYPDAPKGPSRNLGKAPVRSGEPPLGPSSRPSSMQPQRFADSRASSTTSSSVSSSWDPPELVHPSRRSLIDNTGPLNIAARDQSSAQTFDRPGRAYFSPESTRYSITPSQHEAGQVRMPYSPTPGPSSYSARPYAKLTTNVRSPNRGSTKTPGPPDGKKGMGSIELGTPRLRSTYKDLPSATAYEPVAAQLPRAAGKQPVRSASYSVSSPAASQAHTTNERQACKLFSSGSGERATSSTSGSLEPRKKTTPLPDIAATQVRTPLRARTRGASTPITPGPAASTRSAEMPNNELEPCKHRQKGQECEKCGCGNCHRPGRICSKQRAEARAEKRKADNPDVKVEPSASDTQLAPVPKKKKPRIRDSVDPVVKAEETAMQLSQLPKKKKKKPRTRDSVGSWYDPIDVN